MTDLPFRPFADDAAVHRIGQELLAHTLPRADWTHEAHLAATCWLLAERPDIDVDRDISTIISAYNVSVGGVNDDHNGYHDTITRCFIAGVRLHLAQYAGDVGLAALVNALLASPMGQRDWPRRFYSADRLMSAAARRGFVAPDLAPLPVP